ncbi:MAG: hypothetical protein HXO93_02505 [Streptococcus sanguinis]|jgi:hypothetical protein|uniref:Uncharacterized protein n=1 Tax=Streptococcus sanguinis TaxID=1305 RepID=A0A3P1S683_STRSA|nr:hypothetical protein [Streptococcus sanguinis]MBF1699664.1 hypothetical protein [Streptococcus sanguinis]RRC91742.1 hypothetical protein EII39_07065 [Streptococcus sanguinis]
MKYHEDDLLADSLQIENYIFQSQSYPCSQLLLDDMRQELSRYLQRYHQVSPDLQFRVFLFSAFYGQKAARILKEIGGGDIVQGA